MSRKQVVLQLAVSLMMVLVVTTAIATVDTSQKVALASCQVCGDGYCAPRCENATTCPKDCAPSPSVVTPKADEQKTTLACGKCGDGQCVRQCGETATSCPADCGGTGVPSAAPAPKSE